jgi:hypothetical protein
MSVVGRGLGRPQLADDTRGGSPMQLPRPTRIPPQRWLFACSQKHTATSPVRQRHQCRCYGAIAVANSSLRVRSGHIAVSGDTSTIQRSLYWLISIHAPKHVWALLRALARLASDVKRHSLWRPPFAVSEIRLPCAHRVRHRQVKERLHLLLKGAGSHTASRLAADVVDYGTQEHHGL